MSNEVNISKMYQFIASFNKNGESWVSYADSNYGNNDKTLIKAEFRTFVNEEFANWNGNEGGTVSSDLINQFWKKIDTNTSASKISGTKLRNLNALDKNEVANMEKTLEAYIQFDEFLAKNVQAPAVLLTTGSKWKSDVTSELSVFVENFIKDGCKGDLNTILAEALPEIATRNTAEYCALEYQQNLKNTILAEYPEYDVTSDATLTGLLANYLAGLSPDTTAEEIKAGIKAIMDAYLATAGLGSGSNYDLNSLGFNKDAINGIQVAVITQNIKNALKNEAKNYEGFEEYFNEAVEKFINSKIQSGKTFEELKDCASEFLTSKFKTQLDNIVTVEKLYRDIKDDSSFYEILIDEFGATLAKRISQSERDLAIYNEIVDNVVTKVANGELTMDEVADYVINEIRKNLTSFYGNSLGDLPIAELNKAYDDLAKSAETERDNARSLEMHKEAAIKYCQALVDKGRTSLTDLIKEVFGTADFKTAINNMQLRGDIFDKMEILKAEALKIGDIDKETESNKINSSIDWKNIEAKFQGYVNTTGGSNTEIQTLSIKDLYQKNGVVNLLNTNGLLRGDWIECVNTAKNNVVNIVDMLTTACLSSGNYDKTALETAADKVKALYQGALEHSLSNWADKKSDRNNLYYYEGENYQYTVRKWHSKNTANNVDFARDDSAANNQLGLSISESYKKHDFQILINTTCLMDLLNKYYKQALG